MKHPSICYIEKYLYYRHEDKTLNAAHCKEAKTQPSASARSHPEKAKNKPGGEVFPFVLLF